MNAGTNTRRWSAVLWGASAILLSSCAAPAAGTGAQTVSGAAKGGPATDQAAAVPVGPSESSKMVCGQETRDNIAKSLALQTPPQTSDTWADRVYTCTYHVSDGPLILSVKESADPASARTYFETLQKKLGTTHPIEGLANLGLQAYETPGGAVVFVKDNMTLDVDASKLPGKIGPNAVTPSALAYEIATAVLACWSGQ